MTFFVTSVGPGKGGDLGGLAGADQHCQTLAQAVGITQHTWRFTSATEAWMAIEPPKGSTLRDYLLAFGIAAVYIPAHHDAPAWRKSTPESRGGRPA